MPSGRPSMNKRRKELERRQWQEQKGQRKAQRANEPKPGSMRNDADLADIVPGPQPPLDPPLDD